MCLEIRYVKPYRDRAPFVSVILTKHLHSLLQIRKLYLLEENVSVFIYLCN